LTRRLLPALSIAAQVSCVHGCDIGNNDAIYAFHAKVRHGTPVVDAIVDGESAQAPGVGYVVTVQREPAAGRVPSVALPRSAFCICREQGPAKVSETDGRCSEQRADGVEHCPAAIFPGPGLATRDALRTAVAEALPPFNGRVHFLFMRKRGGVNRDSFSVEVDKGLITTVSDVQWDE